MGDIAMWNKAEAQLEDCMKRKLPNYKINAVSMFTKKN